MTWRTTHCADVSLRHRVLPVLFRGIGFAFILHALVRHHSIPLDLVRGALCIWMAYTHNVRCTRVLNPTVGCLHMHRRQCWDDSMLLEWVWCPAKSVSREHVHYFMSNDPVDLIKWLEIASPDESVRYCKTHARRVREMST